MSAKQVFIMGGSGALGSAFVKKFADAGWQVTSVDFRANDAATSNIVISGSDWKAHSETIKKGCEGKEFNAVLCAAGGFAMESIGSDDVFDNMDKMYSFNIKSAVLTSHICAKFGAAGALLLLTGAKAALGPTAWAISYGMTKAATHSLIKSLAVEEKEFKENTTVVGIMPITIDTPSNRESMPDADKSTWTSPAEIAGKAHAWAEDAASRPASGALVEIVTKDGSTAFNAVA